MKFLGRLLTALGSERPGRFGSGQSTSAAQNCCMSLSLSAVDLQCRNRSSHWLICVALPEKLIRSMGTLCLWAAMRMRARMRLWAMAKMRISLRTACGVVHGRLTGTFPHGQPIAGAQMADRIRMPVSCCAQAKNCLHASRGQLGHRAERTVRPVCQDNVVGLQAVPQLAPQTGFMCGPSALNPIKQSSGSQAEEPCQLHDRKSATRLLCRTLRQLSLVLRSVRHARASAIDHFDIVSVPEWLAVQIRFGLFDSVSENLLQQSDGQPTTRLNVGTRVGARTASPLLQAPCLHSLDDTPAPHSEEYLAQERPKSYLNTENPITAVRTAWAGLQ